MPESCFVGIVGYVIRQSFRFKYLHLITQAQDPRHKQSIVVYINNCDEMPLVFGCNGDIRPKTVHDNANQVAGQSHVYGVRPVVDTIRAEIFTVTMELIGIIVSEITRVGQSKSEGTDSSRACWQAYLGKNGAPDRIPVYDIDRIHIAESAYDMMSYVQLHQGRLDFDRTLFVSVGGTYTNELMTRLFNEYPHAVPVLHFDNDLTGVMYDIRAAAIKMGKTLRSTTANGEVHFFLDDKKFTVNADNLSYDQFIKASGVSPDKRPDIRIEKAPGDFKDWNEVLQTAMKAEKAEKKPYVSDTVRAARFSDPIDPEEMQSRFKR